MSLSPAFRWQNLAVCSHDFFSWVGQRGSENSLVSLLIRKLISSHQVSTLWFHLTLIVPSKALFPLVAEGIRASIYELERDTIQSIAPLNNKSPFHTPLSSCKPPFYSLLAWVWLLEIFHTSGRVQRLSFCVWFMSLRVMCSSPMLQRTRSPFLRLNNIQLSLYTMFYLSNHLSMDVSVVSVFGYCE